MSYDKVQICLRYFANYFSLSHLTAASFIKRSVRHSMKCEWRMKIDFYGNFNFPFFFFCFPVKNSYLMFDMNLSARTLNGSARCLHNAFSHRRRLLVLAERATREKRLSSRAFWSSIKIGHLTWNMESAGGVVETGVNYVFSHIFSASSTQTAFRIREHA